MYEEAYRTADVQELRSSALNNVAHLKYSLAGSDYDAIAQTLPIYREALEIDNGNVDAWYNLGKALEDLGRREEAKQAFETVLSLDPEHPGGYLSLGNYHLLYGDSQLALDCFQKVVDSNRAMVRDMRSALTNMGQQYRLLHRHEEAREAFKRCIELDDGDTSAWSNLMVASRTLCDWEGLEDLQARIINGVERDLG